MNKITLRKARESDLMFYFNLRNEEGVRRASFNPEAIDLETHTSWFLNKIKDPNCFMFVALECEKPIGQMRIDIEGKIGETNISLTSEGRGKGYAPIVIKQALEEVAKKIPELKILVAHIKPNNIASIKSFERAGFVRSGAVHYKSTPCLELIFEIYNGEK